MSTIIFADRVITGSHDLHDAWVCVDNGFIVDAGIGNPPSGQIEQVDGWLIPGFVDIHVHGGGGGSFSHAEVATVTDFHLAHGTTTMLASLVSENLTDLQGQIDELRPHVEQGRLAGIHLEGPFIASSRRGAHNAAVLMAPSTEAVEALLATAAGTVRMVTVAPELPDAQAAIAALVRAGVVVALGHSDATSAEAHFGVNTGATVVTHLFNGMRPMHHRESGLAEIALLDSRVRCELILDGHHLSAETTEIALRLLGDRWFAVTDAVAAAGIADGVYSLGGLTVEARQGVVRLQPDGALAGSTLTMDRAFEAILATLQRSPLEAVQATATRPASVIGRHDIGVLRPGARADLLVWRDGAVARVMRNGEWVAAKPHQG